MNGDKRLAILEARVINIIVEELVTIGFESESLKKEFMKIIEKHNLHKKEVFSPLIEEVCIAIIEQAVTACYEEI